MNSNNNLELILIALMMTEAKLKYDLGFVDESNLQYSGNYIQDLPRAPKNINGVYNGNNNYPLGANPKHGGFRR